MFPIDLMFPSIFVALSLFYCLHLSAICSSVHPIRRWWDEEVSGEDGREVAVTPCNVISSESMIRRLLQNYSRSVSPSKPVTVQVETTIQDINELNVMSNSFRADLWFSAIWNDPRLAFAHYDRCRQNLSFDDTFEKYLWSPNVCLVNTKVSEVHRSPKPNVLLMLMQNGTVWLNYRVRVEAPCAFRLSDFPMDTVVCSLVFESYSFNTATVIVDWMPTAVTLLTTDISASDYELTHTKHYKHIEYYKAGEWYRLTLEIGFRRRFGYYILQVYANLYINVFLSWIAFCISLRALSARVILSLNTLMSLCLQFSNVIGSLPPVSYVKSIDYFMFTCIAFIFASLLEMAFIAYKDKRMVLRSLRVSLGIDSFCDLAEVFTREEEARRDSGRGKGRNSGNNRRRRTLSGKGQKWWNNVEMDVEDIGGEKRRTRGRGGSGSCGNEEEQQQGELMMWTEMMLTEDEEEDVPRVHECMVHSLLTQRRRTFLARGHRIDQISFVLFPMAFSLFNAIYWTYYLTKSYGDQSSR